MDVRQIFRKYSFPAIITISAISMTNTLYQHANKLSELENSGYITKWSESTGNLYGYDDNKDGTVDRIEEAGMIPFRTGTPAFGFHTTHLPTDQNYGRYSSKLKTLGTRR